MMRALSRAMLGLGLCASAWAEDHWAVLLAGSNGFFNYRHQADVCHAYQLLIKRGFHPDRIITMMYDDVANSPENPFKGKLYNYPWKTMEEAVDVYAGCKLDYTGNKVSPDTFVAVLTGDAKTAGGKVLQSKADDHVFVNFVDHGAVGLIAFPADQDVLHAKRLLDTLQAMHKKGMYKQLTFYLEACESGSMFAGVGMLPADLPVYAVTAANADESSWGTYCGDEASVGGKPIGSCLGDLFSVNWMEDSEKHMDDKESFLVQYENVKNLTSKSHVMQFGQVKTFDPEPVSAFQGPGSNLLLQKATTEGSARGRHASAVPSRNVKLDQLYRDFARTGSAEAGARLVEEIQAKRAVTELGEAIAAAVVGNELLGELPAGGVSWTAELLDCHEHAVSGFGAVCGWTEGRLALSKVLYQLCGRTSGAAAPVLAGLRKACPPSQTEILA